MGLLSKKSLNYFLVLVVFLFLLNSVNAETYYIGHSGTDTGDCSIGGTIENPWATWRENNQGLGCFNPGDVVYILPGIYETGTGFFDGYSDTKAIKFKGESGNPITIAPDPRANGDWPVKFKGSISLSDEGGIIEGIEFIGDPASIVVAGSHITLRNNYIHGPDTNINLEVPGSEWDCVKIYSSHNGVSEIVRDIKIYDNEIAYCNEDCIDVTGAEELHYRGNHLHHCWFIQIKGGTKDIIVEDNIIHDTNIHTPL